MPEIHPKDVKSKINEIFRSHVCYKSFSSELIKRVLQNYLNELDPTKTYFLEQEINYWTHPDDALLQKAMEGFQLSDYVIFYDIHAIFLNAVSRRNVIASDIAKTDLPIGVKNEEFQNMEWARNREELMTRVSRIRALQIETADKMGQESRERLIQRLEKRRLNREAELTGQTAEEERNIILTHVLKAAASALDAHTNYFTPGEANQFVIQVQQRLFGIGAQLRDDLDGLTIMRILENSPAQSSMKLKINDKIIAVNHEPIVGMDITEAVELIRGEKGTSVHLTFLRDGEKMELTLMRGEVVLEESRLETQLEPYGDGCIALLRLFSFYQDAKFSSAQDMRKALEQIKKKDKLNGVIIDLRGNAGGLLTQAVSVTGLFITKGIVVSVKDNTGQLQHLREVEDNLVWSGPLIVLVDRASASAAEIVAQTLQDYGRAIIVGDDHTFGKGSFQTFTLDPIQNLKINPQGEYKVTRGRYYTVSGKSPQLKGVLADIVVPGLMTSIDIGEQFAKFPLDNDEIEPHFEDDLSDLSAFHRIQLGMNYRHNVQKRMDVYVPYLELLKRHSHLRIEKDKNYQNFLTELKKKNFDSQQVDLFGQSDLQYQETLNIMKDLIYLLKQEAALL
ncbi:MAG TPA: S41 family peptidase [Chlamydiales bacterium]|nr:S41 family peptidase [Chlamydiales bacterium]